MAKPDFCTHYGVTYPVVLAGMAMISEPELVAAVANAGGLGILGTGMMPPDVLRASIAETRRLTNRPFGVNQIVETTALGPLTTEDDLAVIAELQVSPIVFFWNLPPAHWLDGLRRSGVAVWQTVTSLEEAEAALAAGVDALMVQGLEAGGHNRSQLPLIELLAPIARRAGSSHVIGAGGIADARSAAAALAAGADAVCMGTRFVACTESPAHPEWKERIVASTSADTVVTRLFGPEWPDAPMRVIRNRAVARAESAAEGSGPGAPVGHTRLFGQTYAMPPASAVLPTEATSGDLDEMCLAAGTSAGLVSRIRGAAEIVREIGSALGR